MKIVCPNCNESNEIEFAEHIKCKCCNKSFKDRTYSIKTITKPMIASASAVLVAGSIIGYTVENLLDEVRYPLHFEYSIITQCANPNNNGYMQQSVLQRNINICICALDKTIKDVGYKQEIDEELRTSFRNNLDVCK